MASEITNALFEIASEAISTAALSESFQKQPHEALAKPTFICRFRMSELCQTATFLPLSPASKRLGRFTDLE